MKGTRGRGERIQPKLDPTDSLSTKRVPERGRVCKKKRERGTDWILISRKQGGDKIFDPWAKKYFLGGSGACVLAWWVGGVYG